MALSTGTVTVKDSWYDMRQEVVGTIAFGANPLTYAAGGLVTPFNVPGVKSTQPPSDVWIRGIGGFIYVYVPGTDITLGKVMVFTEGTVATNAPLIEHSVAALVAGVSGDTITFHAWFKIR